MKEIIRNHSKGKFTIHLIKDQDFMIEYFYDNVKLNDLFLKIKEKQLAHIMNFGCWASID